MELLDFADHEYINLVTYKKRSTLSSSWAASDVYKRQLVITSSKSAGKVKRINNNGRATIYITDQMGSSTLSDLVHVKASLIEDEETKQAALNKIIKKYGSISKMFIRGANENRSIIRIDEIVT